MAWRPHARVKVNARRPAAAAICDRCGIPTNHYLLRFQFDFQGQQLQNLRVLVCDRCEDVPQRQLGAKILSPDPLPIFNARPEPFTTTGVSYQESNVVCQPQLGRDDSAADAGFAGDGPQMAMPDGTLMLMPFFLAQPEGGYPFNSDFNNDLGGEPVWPPSP